MLIYHPAFDAYHCTFRMLVIAEIAKKLEADKLRIIDFYLALPSAIASVTLPHELIHLSRSVKANRYPYRETVNPRITFRDLKEIQEASMRCLAGANLIEQSQLSLGVIERSKTEIVPSLNDRLQSFLAREGEIALKIIVEFLKVPLLGHNGLKDRSGLMEFRYDNV